MLAGRMLLSLVLLTTTVSISVGQERLHKIRNLFHGRTATNDCQSGCGQQADCSGQGCAGYQPGAGYGQFNPVIHYIDPETGGISWSNSGPQPNMGYPVPGLSTIPSNNFSDNGVAALDDMILPPNNFPADVGTAGSAGQTADDRFDLTSQFAGRGQEQGVRDLAIGDFFSGSGAVISGGFNSPITVPIAGGDRRYKISDHFSPIPVNRTYFSYHGFGDAVRDVNGNQADVQRFTFGLEKLFWQNNASFEIRLPFTHGVNSTQVQDFSSSAQTGNALGNVTLATKFLLVRRQNLAITTGMATTLPTAGDAEVILSEPVPTTLNFENEGFELIPFLSFYFQPRQNSWVTLTTQLDFNVWGFEVISDVGTPDEQRGRYNDQNLFSMDLTAGHWFWNNADRCNGLIRGVAGIFELHYTSTINNSDIVDVGYSTIENPYNRTDTLNSTIGLRFQVKDSTFATFAGVFPWRVGEDRPFENEFNFNLSRLY